MKALIIEDSRLARKELTHLLESIDGVEVVGEAANAEQALVMIRELEPDLLFLDIEMPGKNGFELLEALDDAPRVIFTTAYNEYAIKAFEVNALDYLQKPLTLERLKGALAKLPKEGSEPRNVGAKLGEDSRVFVKDGERCWFVRLADIALFEIEGNYTRIYFGEERPLIPKSLNYLEERLDDAVFFRANRQQVINLKAIEKIEPWFSGGLKLALAGGLEVEVSRRQASRFKEMMSF